MTNITTQIDNYISAHKLAWAESTLRSERHRLMGVREYLHLPPADFYNTLNTRFKPYSMKTLFTRISHFIDWQQLQGGNEYRKWMKHNALLFKRAYTKSPAPMSFEEARSRLTVLPGNVRRHCEAILDSGVRIDESFNVEPDGTVVGKGSKKRKIFVSPERFQNGINKQDIYRHLKKVGLKPHDLRKIFATRLARKGLQPEDLCAIMGWSSFDVAISYIAAASEDKLDKQIQEALV